MRVTCTKHAVYQGVKQGCDICSDRLAFRLPSRSSDGYPASFSAFSVELHSSSLDVADDFVLA